jgi:dihydroorotate dehydrogenase
MLALKSLGIYNALAKPIKLPSKPKELMGLSFPNPVGLAAGMDKNGDYIHGLSKLGFGFIEVGTITPQPQKGHPKPRLFRLPQSKAIINRMGFNNKGADYLANRLWAKPFPGILGISIGKNAQTPLSAAKDDYADCMKTVYPYASYIALNISSPNTKGLRDIAADTASLLDLLLFVNNMRSSLEDQHGFSVPLVLKVSPDMEDDHLNHVAFLAATTKVQGIIATNTTGSLLPIKRITLYGGLSGPPLKELSLKAITLLRKELGKQSDVAIIGCGGISSGKDVKEMQQAGADLIQILTGFVYQGPALIHELVAAWN